MKKKVVYITHWMPEDTTKEYPHGWGFEPPVIEFAQDRDPTEVSKLCIEKLWQPGFSCIGATAREFVDGEFEVLGISPGPEKDSEEWAIRDIDIILDNADFDSAWKVKEINNIVRKYFDTK